MDATKLQLLEMTDDLVACEYPVNFDFRVSMQRVKALKPKLDAIAGKTFEIDENVQDASFFTELAIFEEADFSSNTGKIIYTVLGIRFSSFGNLFTIWSNSVTEKLKQSKVDEIIAETERHGFVFVEVEALDEPYTGKHLHLSHLENWWLRYFDYL